MTDTVQLSDVRPSQLYLNAEKLAAVLDRVDATGFECDPIPVYEFDSDLYLTDGHTRAFVAYLTGSDQLTVEYDENLAEEYDVTLYRECIEWCNDADVKLVPDLAGRVLDPESYERQWVERCHGAAERLE